MKLLKRAGQAVLALLLLLVVAVGGVWAWSGARMARSYDVNPVPVAVATDVADLEWGRHVAEIRGCTDCHGEDMGGSVFADEMPVFLLSASNLTSGEGGVAGQYRTDADWVRAIRHGVGPDGKPLLFMPSYEYRAMGPRDVGALVGWLKSLEPVDRALPASAVGPVGRGLFVAGKLPLLAAELIDHEDRSFSQPETGVTVEYGRYVASSCVGCHNAGYSGGPIPGVPPEWPAAANLTPHAESTFREWTKEDFRTLSRTGRRPDGREVDRQYMPWHAIGAMTETEFEALWLFLRSLEPRATGT